MIMTFAIWLTGYPASGKSRIARALVRSIPRVEVLESDVLRKVITPSPRYDDNEREVFYRAMAFMGSRLVAHEVPVIFDATANLRRWRDLGRELIPRFLEVFVDTPIEVCRARDPKGLYLASREGKIEALPGAGASYEPPLSPELRVTGLDSDRAAAEITSALRERRWL
jgi:adenylylsulfate kinase